MATGILGTQTEITAANYATLYTVPADTFAVVTVNLVNKAATDRVVRIALAAADTPTNAEFIEYGTTLIANGVVERGGIVLQAGKKVVVWADSTDVTAMCFGIETSTV